MWPGKRKQKEKPLLFFRVCTAFDPPVSEEQLQELNKLIEARRKELEAQKLESSPE